MLGIGKEHPLVFEKLFQGKRIFLKLLPLVLDHLGKEFTKLMPLFPARRKVKIKKLLVPPRPHCL